MGRHTGPVERLSRREGVELELKGEAQGSRARTGDRLLESLERRLHNVLYRLGFAGTRAQARQFVYVPIDEQLVVEHFSRR